MRSLQSPEVKMLLGFLDDSADVDSPCKVLCDALSRAPAPPPEVYNHLFCLVHTKKQVAGSASLAIVPPF